MLRADVKFWARFDSGSYEALRQDSVPARGRRSASRPGARDDAGRGRAWNPRGDARGRWDECRVESELSFADREWNAAAPDQHDTAPAGEVFQGASWLSRRRSGGISRGAAERSAGAGDARREAGPLADRRSGALPARSGAAARAAGDFTASGF